MERVNKAVRADDVNAHVYNLKAVVKETGLNPATLRAWERRYGMPQPQRTKGGHRQYCRRDIDTLLWLIARQEEGMSIGNASQLWQTLNEQGDTETAKAILGNLALDSQSTFATEHLAKQTLAFVTQ